MALEVKGQKELIERFEKVGLLVSEGYAVTDACELVGLPRSTFYRRKADYRRYIEGDANAFEPKSRAPKRLARKTPAGIREEVIRLARCGGYRHASQIARAVHEKYDYSIHRGTVVNILEAAELYGFRRDVHGRRVGKRREVLTGN